MDREEWPQPPGEESQRAHPEWYRFTSPLHEFLSIGTWAERAMPDADRLLGELVTSTSRVFLVGRTGLGKTLLALALACGMASGQGFLHWRSDRPARVLVIDGEMPGELIRQRAIDLLRRAGVRPDPEMLMIYARDLEEEFANKFPNLGTMPPLNTDQGCSWVLGLLDAIGDVDVVIFDNVMSLLKGDQKDEVTWTDTLPLVQALTARRIGQIWLDHTGHDASRQYGSSTKAWRFDALGVMTPLEEEPAGRGEVAFTLSFEPPGKARRRTPDNWRDFETCTIRLREDRWIAQPATPRKVGAPGKLPPSRTVYYDALVVAIGRSTGSTTSTSISAWLDLCVQRGLVDRPPESEDYKHRDARLRDFRKAKSELLAARWIAIDGDVVIDLKHQPG